MEKRKKTVGFLKFIVVSFVTCYVVSGLVWSIWLAIWSPGYYIYARPQDHVNTLVRNILPLAVPPVAISVIIYRKFRTKLNPLEIFLSSWYVSTCEVVTFFWIVLSRAYGTRAHVSTYYPPPEFAFLSLLVAEILSIAYFVRLRRKRTH